MSIINSSKLLSVKEAHDGSCVLPPQVAGFTIIDSMI